MKRIALTAGLASVVLGLSASSALARPLTLHVVSVTATDHLVDNPPANSSPQTATPGDVDVFTDRVLAGVRQIGRDAGACTMTDSAHALCDVTMVLFRRGTLEFHGLANFSVQAAQPVAVVGGTGQFAGRRGWALVRNVGATRTAVSIHLL